MSVKVNRKDFDKLLKQLPRGSNKAWRDTGDFYKDITPIDTGNARKRTRTTNNKIKANYAYADSLDSGWSDQAPRGMTDPSLEYYEEQITKMVRTLNGP